MFAGLPVAAGAATLTNGAGDGKVTMGVTGTGAFGGAANVALGATDAFYDPIGSTGPAATTYESYLYLGFGGVRINVGTLSATITAQSATSVTSSFVSSGLTFVLL